MTNVSTAQPDSTELRALVARVAAKCLTYRYYHWDWGESIAMEGLWLAQRITGEKRFGDFVFHMIESWMQYRPNPWCPDHVGPGRMLVELWEHSCQQRFLDYARRLADLPPGRWKRYGLP